MHIQGSWAGAHDALCAAYQGHEWERVISSPRLRALHTAVALAVPSLSHLWVDLTSPKAELQLKAASSCNVDATCMAVKLADWGGGGLRCALFGLVEWKEQAT